MVYTTYPKAAQTSGDNSNGFAKYVSGLKVLNRLWYASLSFHNTICAVDFLLGVVAVVVVDDEPPSSPSQSALLLVVGVEDDSNADLQLAKVASTDAVISSAVFLIFIFLIAVLLSIINALYTQVSICQSLKFEEVLQRVVYLWNSKMLLIR